MQFIFNQPLPKKFIKENEIAKVRYNNKCIDRNVQCGQGRNHNDVAKPSLKIRTAIATLWIYLFSNFSCRFLNPNNFFHFEL